VLDIHMNRTILREWQFPQQSSSPQPKQRAGWESVVSGCDSYSIHGLLAGFRIEGRDRARYVHLEGEGLRTTEF
jgi:hypothetical protein